MFHLKYPASRNFMTWDELGVGDSVKKYKIFKLDRDKFPADLFKSCSYTDDVDINCDENGMAVKSILRILDLNLLCNDLHLTYNMHTADWNTRAINRALQLLVHRVLDFDGVHNTRLAYGTYEHVDMKGMVLGTLTILRALKMCGRAIAPLKLKHRLKHMKTHFQHPDRIQLDEFFILILWCDLYEAYSHGHTEAATGKDGDLFKMVDFGRLLSHHDERLAIRLNVQFLQEERDYGTETLGPKDMFKDSTVNTERLTEQVQIQKINYQPLQLEVNQSERRVHKAQAGSVRSRPINVPDLDKYRQAEKSSKPPDLSVHSAFESVQRRLHSAPPTSHRMNLYSDRPQVTERAREQTPRAVTPRDLSDVECKLQDLLFDMSTLETRRQVQVENEMMFYIPGFLHKPANRMSETAETPSPQPAKKQHHSTSQIIKRLAYPPSLVSPTHDKVCDARFRGWHQVNCSPGYNFVLTSQSSNISERGTIPKTRQNSSAFRLSVHPNYVVRYTPRLMSSRQDRRGVHENGLELKKLALTSLRRERTTDN